MSLPVNHPYQITDREYSQIQNLILDWTGISLGPNKRPLVIGRLGKRLRHYQLATFSEYLIHPLQRAPEERQVMIDLLTTNETYFFREPAHFEYVEQQILPHLKSRPVRAWSAACSTGEEPYTLAMVLANHLDQTDWSILATDINRTVLDIAQSGLYDLSAADKIPPRYRERYCLKGVRAKAGLMMIEPSLRDRIQFQPFNLQSDGSRLGQFDLIFLRNVMIYFNLETKRSLISRMVDRLNPGGFILVGHSETLNGLNPQLVMKKPSIYQKMCPKQR